jgi:hypothetical protein
MKAKLEFNLPEDGEDFTNAVNGTKWKIAMWDLDQWLRSQTKYAPDTMSDDTYKALESCRDELRRIVGDSNLDLE